MTVVAGVTALVVVAVWSWRLLRRTPAGTTWDDWQRAPLLGGTWAPLTGVAVSLAMAVGLAGFGVPGPVRAVLLGAVMGFCLPWAVEGARRRRRARAEVERPR